MGLITQDDLRELASKAKACNVAFIWSIHPALEGGGINFNNLDPGVEAIMEKFDHLYKLGIRHFGVSIDDMSGHPYNQSDLADKAQIKLYEKFNKTGVAEEDKVGPLLFVPTQYALNYGTSTLSSFKNIHKDVLVAFTGYDCFSNIRGSACDRMADLIGRNPIMWWNNPVNDDYDEFLYMHGLTARWTIEDKTPISSLQGLVLNPMNQGQASKIALFSSADYAWNPAKFDETASWEASLSSIVTEPELTEALKTFIGVMSAYTTHDTRTPEGEKFSSLYTAFQSAYSKENIPDATQLLNEMEKANEACKVLQTLKSSENKEYNLFYEDIKCWLAKVESMTDIVVKSLSLMKNQSDLSSWTDFAIAQANAQKIHTDPKFQLSVLEGKGTSSYEQFKEVQPTPKYLDSFIDFLAGKLSDHAPLLPERSREMEVITNIKNLPVVNIQTEENVTKLSGLNSVTLKPGEYTGIYFNAIKEVTTGTLPASLTDNLSTEYSINGKEWTGFIPTEESTEQMAYFRIMNSSNSDQSIPINEISFRMPASENSAPVEATTNMGTYQTYSIKNVIDGNYSTKFWSNSAQKAGDYIQLDFGVSAARFDITLHFADGDTPTGEALIQLSDNAQDWTTVKSFTASAISNNMYTCNAGGKSARYVRLYLKSINGGNWFQLMEFEVTGSRITPVAEDNEGNPITLLDDRSLAAGYQAQDAGYVIYRFIENISIDEIQIFHNSTFVPTADKPTITVCANGKWINKGELDAACTSIQVADLQNISQLKITWNKDNIPVLYEIMPVENLFIEENKAITIPQTSGTSGYRLQVPETILGDRSGSETDRTGKSFTLASWINMDKFTNESKNKGNVIMGHGPQEHMNYNGSLILSSTESGELKVIAGASNKIDQTLSSRIDLDTWTYLTLIYDNDTHKVSVYKNGISAGEEIQLSRELDLFPDNPCIFFVGGMGFSGLCDELQFFNKALSAAEVQQAYQAPQDIPNLTAWYTFNSIDGNSEGAFLNKATASGKTDEEAVFFKYTGTKSSDGGLISGSVTETVPTLTDGRIPTAVFHTVTVPAEVANGTLTVMNGNIPLIAGENQIEEGTVLTITAIPAKGYQLKSIRINGVEIKGNTFIIEKESTITVEFTQDTTAKRSITCNITGNGTVKITDDENNVYENGIASILDETKITLTFIPETGYELNDFIFDGDSMFDDLTDKQFIFIVDEDYIFDVIFSKITSERDTPEEVVSIRYESGALYVQGMNTGDRLDIYDIAGNNVRTSGMFQTDVTDLTDGYYLVRVSLGNTVKTVKFIKR
jgi:hyaluronoglucosaminidase